MKLPFGISSSSSSSSSSPPPTDEGLLHKIAKISIRALQCILGLTVAGIYGNHINNQLENKNAPDSAFLFAVVVAGLSCVSSLLFLIPKIKTYHVFAWDWILTIFWLGIFGKFAALFISKDPNNSKDVYEGTNTQQMKNVVWIDLINLFLWLMTAAYGTFTFVRRRRQAKQAYVDDGPVMGEVA